MYSDVACQGIFDLVMAMDTSGSVSMTELPLQKQFMKNLLARFNLRSNGVRVAIISYSNIAVNVSSYAMYMFGHS